jgi:hypothetical protein
MIKVHELGTEANVDGFHLDPKMAKRGRMTKGGAAQPQLRWKPEFFSI